MTPTNDIHAIAREVYLRHAGRSHRKIETEIRALGFPRFDRRCFYSRVRNGKTYPGWIEKFGWPVSVHSSASRQPTQPPNAFQQWLKQVSPEMNWDWKFQKLIYEKLHRITTGDSKRLMIFLPPRHGKSELATIRYPAWRLWQDPKMRVIIACYNQHLANKFSRSMRRLLAAEEDKLTRNSETEMVAVAKTVDPLVTDTNAKKREPEWVTQCRERQLAGNPAAVRMFPTSRNINTMAEWETALGGGAKAVGVGAGVTGFGAMLMVIDDPVKSRAQAESITYRDRVWEWFKDDIYTRLEPNASIILIQTRWHEDDLAGRILKEMDNGGERWEVLSLPALAEEYPTAEAQRRGESQQVSENETSSVAAEPANINETSEPETQRLSVSAVNDSFDLLGRAIGEALCPERYDREALLERKDLIGSYSFSALYQQTPVPRDGGLFKRKWFSRIVENAPEGLRWHRAYDLAVSTKTSADYTASFRCAKDKNGDLYIADGFRGRIEFPEQRAYVIERMKAEKNTAHAIEEALHGKAFVQELRRDLKLSGVPLIGVRVDRDKFTRALAWAPLAEAGKVVLVRGPWIDEFLEEVCLFPNAPHDDQVDAVSLAVQMIGSGDKKAHGF